ncbi:MAG TPA: Wzz/FepE/Etk N-terminal domain-containing protein [Candidatus Acidoferrum sp.]|nr:Wzz/FepE/Etk N-terminal domain-containing protein [Candidatus Acidoferrum sp.]
MEVHRQLSVEEYVTLLLRRKWLFLTMAVLGAATGLLLAAVIPAQYTSHTMVLVEEPVVPDSYVKPVVSEDVNQRLASMQGEILSRTRLQDLVAQFNPYKRDLSKVPMEVLIERLRQSIKVAPLNPMPGTSSHELPGFTVDVTLSDPHLAQQICNEVSSMFRNQNIQQRQKQTVDTTEFLAKQLTDAKAKLDEQDAKLAAFQSRHIGALPEDEKTNVTLLSGMTTQLEAATQGLNQARQQKTYLESMLTQQLAALRTTSEDKNSKTLDQQLSDLKNQLGVLQRSYTDKHPSVIKVKAAITQLEKQIEAAPAEKHSAAESQKPAGLVAETPEIQQYRAQLRQAELNISQKAKEQEDLQRQVRAVQGRIELSPAIQQEFKFLTRDHETALNFYNDLLKKKNESQMATTLENQQQSEKFKVLDPPSMPERPSFPNRNLFTLGGLCAGLALGVGIVHLSEARDKSIRTRQDVETLLGVQTLAVISHMGSARKIRNQGPGRRRPELSFAGSLWKERNV